MINHVVLFKLKDYPETEKPLIIAEMKSLLEGLKGKIDELKYIEVGVNYELNAKSCFTNACWSHEYNFNLVIITAQKVHQLSKIVVLT